jgi:hypothetical protein
VRWLAATVCLTMLFGFIILFTAVGALANRGLPVDPLVIISALGLCGIFVIELSLIRIISRLLFEAKESLRLPAAKASGANELGPASAPHLVQPAITTGPIHSVTDHTTRTLGQSHGGKSL